MSEKVSLRTIYVISLLFFGIVLILGACMDPVDIDVFLNDETVKSVVEKNKEAVKLTADSPKYLVAGNKKITGLKDDKYYVIESIKDEGSTEKLSSPQYVQKNGAIGDDLFFINRVSGGIIGGLTNNYTYKITEAEKFTFTGTLTVVNSTSPSATVTNGETTIIPASTAAVTVGGFFSQYNGNEVMAVAVPPSSLSASSTFKDDLLLIDSTGVVITLEGASKTVDYIFAKVTGTTTKTLESFKVLTIKTTAIGGDIMITDKPITGINKPVNGETASTSITNSSEYTGSAGSVIWDPPLVGGKFGSGIEYTATITLTAKAGYTFTGVPDNYFTVAGATNVTYTSGTNIVQAKFPATEITITESEIFGILKPEYGGTPTGASDIINTQYSGTSVVWEPLPVGGKFAASTSYKVTIVLAPKTGYTFTGNTASFTVAGVTGTTTYNGANATVEVTFTDTDAVPTTSADVKISFETLSDSGNGALTIVAPNPISYDEIVNNSKSIVFTLSGVTGTKWYFDGTEVTTFVSGNTLTISSTVNSSLLPLLAKGRHYLIVIGTGSDSKQYHAEVLFEVVVVE
jgi:hypothetical protein